MLQKSHHTTDLTQKKINFWEGVGGGQEQRETHTESKRLEEQRVRERQNKKERDSKTDRQTEAEKLGDRKRALRGTFQRV